VEALGENPHREEEARGCGVRGKRGEARVCSRAGGGLKGRGCAMWVRWLGR
jgi:hypothetical protein